MSYIPTNQIYFNKPLFKFGCRRMAQRKKLFENFEEEPSSPGEDAIKVFLRVKPTKDPQDTMQILDSKTLLFKMPAEHMQSRNKLNMPDHTKFTFSHIFPSNVTQPEIFTGCVAPLIKDLFDGQHCLLFTYGTTNAGKTFTVLGTGNHPGIIPRTLTTVFKSIIGKEYKNPRITPQMFNGAIELTDNTLQEELKFKEKILMWNPEKTQSETSRLCKTQSTYRSSFDEIMDESVFKEMQRRLTNDTSIVEYETEPEDSFSVWVSFAEIYNEAIFDLLQPVTLNAKRKQLKLHQDSNRNTFIKGLKHVFVQSEEEAYKVLRFGKNNLQVAATGMNSRSSRSHCIFTIKLMKCPNVEHPERVTVSSFSICDLAGAERQKKTLNVGLRLKESQNINCSLHVLSRCFTIIRENQTATEPQLIPFRDSKLTQLFKHALTGKETVTMIVNVNPDTHLCEETQHVLKASAVAKHIIVQPRPKKRPTRTTRQSMFSQIIRQNRSTLIRWDSCVKSKAHTTIDESAVTEESEKTELEQKQDQYENLLSLVESLKEKLKEEKAKHVETKKMWRLREDEIREEARENLEKMLEDIKKQNALDMERVQQIHGGAEIKKGKRHKSKEGDKSEVCAKKVNKIDEEELNWSFEVKDLKEEVKMQQKQIDGLTDLVNMQRDEKKELSMELANAKLKLGFKDQEIENLKKKIELFGEENDFHASYLALEKDMEEKILVRDDLLQEARNDLLEEIRMREEQEEENAKLEKELMDKEEEILDLKQDIEDLKQEITDKVDIIELIEGRMDRIELSYETEISMLKGEISSLKEELLSKTEEIATLSQRDPDHIDENLKEEYAQLKSDMEQLLCEKAETDKLLAKQQKDHVTHKENYNKETNLLKEEIYLLKEELSLKNEEIIQLRQDLKCLDDINDLQQENAKLKSSIEKLLCEKDELDKLLARQIEEHQAYKEECIKKFDSFEKEIASINSSNESKNDLTEEVSVLEKSLKKQIQDTTRLASLQREKEKENERLKKENLKIKASVNELKVHLKQKEHDLECCRSKMTGYEQLIPKLETEFDLQRKEFSECKKKNEDQMAMIHNMEQELASFQNNQKEIIGKYEEQLKKTKDENESLKKEVARVTNTFYKSTPTPKKVLEKEIEDLKAQLGETKAKCQQYQKEKEDLFFMLTSSQANKENENTLQMKRTKPNTKANVSNKFLEVAGDVDRTRHHSYEESHLDESSQLNIKKCLTSSKTRQRRTRAIYPPVSSDDCDTELIPEEKPRQHSRKKLFTSTCDELFQNDDEVEVKIPEESPGTYVRRNLRNRKK